MVWAYLETRQDELTNWTLRFHKYRLRAFVEWCEESGVDDLTKLDNRDPYEFHVWRHEENSDVEDSGTPEEIAPVVFKSQLTMLRTLLRFAADIHAVSGDFYERVPLPRLSGTDDVSDSTLGSGRAIGTLEYLHHYYYAPQRYVEFALLWETGARMGAIRGLDLCGLGLDGRTPVVRRKHWPDQDTSIKNGKKGE